MEEASITRSDSSEERINERKQADAKLQAARVARLEEWARFFKAGADLSFIINSSEGIAAPIPDENAEMDMQATVEFFRAAFEPPNDANGGGNGSNGV